MPARRLRVSPRAVKRPLSRYAYKSLRVDRRTYKATISIDILTTHSAPNFMALRFRVGTMARFDWLRDADRPFLFNLVFWTVTTLLATGLAQAAVIGAAPLQCALSSAPTWCWSWRSGRRCPGAGRGAASGWGRCSWWRRS